MALKRTLARASEVFGPHVFFATERCDGSGAVSLNRVINPDKAHPPWATQELGNGDTEEAALEASLRMVGGGATVRA